MYMFFRKLIFIESWTIQFGYIYLFAKPAPNTTNSIRFSQFSLVVNVVFNEQ